MREISTLEKEINKLSLKFTLSNANTVSCKTRYNRIVKNGNQYYISFTLISTENPFYYMNFDNIRVNLTQRELLKIKLQIIKSGLKGERK